MTSRRSRKAIPLVKVDLPKEEVEVYKVQDCCQMKVTVEALRRKTGPGQCYRCQQFGHSQLCCRGAVRCVRCAGAHRPSECQVPTSEPAKCANCGGPHPASYGGCPRRPSPTQRQGEKQEITRWKSQDEVCSNGERPQKAGRKNGTVERPLQIPRSHS
nr:unnamed protein product [Callosobruchus chinensis]